MLRNLLRALGPRPPADAPANPDFAAAGPKGSASASVLPATAAPAPADAPAPAGPYAAAQSAQERGDHAAAFAIFRAHIAQSPDDVDAIATLGGALVRQARLDEAQGLLWPALARFPAAAPLLYNSGALAQARMQVDEAIRLFRLALACEPGFAMARYMLAILLLLKGEYGEGLLQLRARNELNGPPSTAWPRQVPRWEGQSLAGKRLLVWSDWGGLGDELQFARYLTPLASRWRPEELIFGCSDAGRRLYAALPGVDRAAVTLDSAEAVDYQAALLDLPVIFGTTLDNMPPAEPYLHAVAAEVAQWAQRLAGIGGRRIGLCWGAGFWGKATRSDKAVPLELLARLAALRDTHFVSLQKGPARAELPCPGLPVLDFDAHINDFGDTAALIQNLDLVISVDTSVAHLAGALGKPVILLLQWESGNFWLLDRADSPWYPSMRIVRQKVPRDWQGVIDQLLQLLS
ncbi:MAG TPA: tetratricopeptide repeat protein [Burkholderiales bacterium]|jgi:hypothetical protein